MTTTVVQLHVHRWGAGNPRRALLVHGLAGAGPTWWRIATALAGAGFDVVAPDLRGHGASPPADRYRFADLAADLVPLGDRWDLVVGHSLGGPIVGELLAVGVAAERVVLVEPVLAIGEDVFAEVTADQVAEADPFADPATLTDAHPGWHPLDVHTKAAAARAVAAPTVAAVMADNRPWDRTDAFDEVVTDVRVLTGDPTVFTFCPAGVTDRLARNPRVTVESVAGAGHSVHRDRPEAVLAACGVEG